MFGYIDNNEDKTRLDMLRKTWLMEDVRGKVGNHKETLLI